MPLARIAGWLFILEGVYFVWQGVVNFAGVENPVGTTQLARIMLFGGGSIVAGIGVLGQMFWGRSLAIYYGGIQVVVGISSLLGFFGAPTDPLWVTVLMTALFAFQCGAVIFARGYFS